MTSTRFVLALVAATTVLFLLAPYSAAFHGAWWQARDTPTTSPVFPAAPSTATEPTTGLAFRADVLWSGQMLEGGLGSVRIQLFAANGQLVHAATLPAQEDVANVAFGPCPFPDTAGQNQQFQTVQPYSLVAPGILAIGGTQRSSFCNDSAVPDFGDPVLNDPLFFKAFSDFTGAYLGVFALDLHVRALDHG